MGITILDYNSQTLVMHIQQQIEAKIPRKDDADRLFQQESGKHSTTTLQTFLLH